MVTIKQIAECAGVSTATVSNVIHGKAHKVSAETLKRIQKLMDEMGYVQEKRQGAIRCEESKLVAAVIHCHHRFENTILADPFYSIIVGNIEEELRRQGCYMMLYVSPHVEEISRMLLTCEVDGVIALSCSKENCKKLQNMIRKPMVSVDAYGETDEPTAVPDVGLDDEEGGILMTRHLVDLGYETIFVAGMENMGIDRQRWLGAKRVSETPQFLEEKRKLEFIELGHTQRKRETRYREIAQQVPFKRKTAIFFTADALAMEAVSYWAEWGIVVPRDIGVAGFDNSINAISYSIPRLTTISQDVRMKAYIAVQELVATLRDPEYQPKSHKLPVTLMSRQSV